MRTARKIKAMAKPLKIRAKSRAGAKTARKPALNRTKSPDAPRQRLLRRILAHRDAIEAEKGVLAESSPLIREDRESRTPGMGPGAPYGFSLPLTSDADDEALMKECRRRARKQRAKEELLMARILNKALS